MDDDVRVVVAQRVKIELEHALASTRARAAECPLRGMRPSRARSLWAHRTGWKFHQPHSAFFYLGMVWLLGGAAENVFDAPLRRLERSLRAALLAVFTVALFPAIILTIHQHKQAPE